MRAAMYYGPGDVRIEDVAEPDPGPGEVRVAPLHNGLCGTDLHQYFVGQMGPTPPPTVTGHEFSARVLELGRDVTGYAVGDLVSVEPLWHCGSCVQCLEGDHNLCVNTLCHGLGAKGGGLSERTVVHSNMLHKLPESVDSVLGAMVEPMSVAYRGVRRSHPQPGRPAIVFGAGPIGIGSYLGLRALGVDEVVMVEPAAARREAVARLGAPHVLDPTATDVVGEAIELTKGGAPVVIDAAGTDSSFQAAIAVAGPKARVVTVAAYMGPVSYNPTDLMMREVELVTSFAYCGDFPEVIGHMAAGRYPIDGWVERVPFETHTDVYERLHHGEAIKVLVDL